MAIQVIQKEWYDIVFDHWAQIAFFLGFIGFCIKTFVDLEMKKREIRFSRVQENKILEIKNYYKSYQLLEIALQRYLRQTYHGEHKQEIFDEITKEILDKFIDFEYNSMTVKLFLEEEDINTINEIMETFSLVNKYLRLWHVHVNDKYSNYVNKKDDDGNLEKIKNVIFPETLPALIKKIEISLRKNFNLHK